MTDDLLLCPECGGLIGATTTTEEGAPCSCFGPLPTEEATPSLSDTDVVPSPASYSTAEKRCVICARDVAGRKRVRDTRGYLCYECYEADKRKLYGDRVRCRSCGRLVKESALENYEGTKMCPECFKERQKLSKLQIQRIGVAGARTRNEMRAIITLSIAGGVLLLIILLASLHVL